MKLIAAGLVSLAATGESQKHNHVFGQSFQESCTVKSHHEVDHILNNVMEFAMSDRSVYLTEAIIKKQTEKRYRGNGDPFEETCSTEPDPFKSGFCPPGGCNVLLDISGIWNYGCWCNFGDNLMEGSGKPVNKFDEVCQKYQLCLRCAKHDAETGGYGCSPKDDTFNAIVGSNFLVQCSAANPGDDCGTHMCSCTHSFISELLSFIWDSVPYDSSKLHTEGFDRVAECPVVGGNGRTNTECCGTYPERVPYNADKKDCCLNLATGEQTTVFHPTFYDCCDDGTTAAPGTCP